MRREKDSGNTKSTFKPHSDWKTNLKTWVKIIGDKYR